MPSHTTPRCGKPYAFENESAGCRARETPGGAGRFAVLGWAAAAIALGAAICCLFGPAAQAATAATEARPLDPALLQGPSFVEVRRLPLEHAGKTAKWYGEFQSASGTRAIYVGAKSSSTGAPYRFVVEYGPGVPPPAASGLVTGKVAGTEMVDMSTSGPGSGSFSFALVPLLVEAKFEPLAQPVSCPVIEDGKPAVPAAPAAPAAPVASPAPSVSAGSVAPVAQTRKPTPVAPSVPAAGPSANDPNPPLEREQEAFRMLGTTFNFGVSPHRLVARQQSSIDNAALSETMSVMSRLLFNKDMSAGLRDAAKVAAERYGTEIEFTCTGILRKPAPLEQLRIVLGAESLVEDDVRAAARNAELDSTHGSSAFKRAERWYHYGWLSFGELDSKVMQIRAELWRLPPAPAK